MDPARAASAGNAEGMAELGRYYRDGVGMERTQCGPTSGSAGPPPPITWRRWKERDELVRAMSDESPQSGAETADRTVMPRAGLGRRPIAIRFRRYLVDFALPRRSTVFGSSSRLNVNAHRYRTCKRSINSVSSRMRLALLPRSPPLIRKTSSTRSPRVAILAVWRLAPCSARVVATV